MSSNIRRGRIPQPPAGVDAELVDQIYSLKGFFGDWAHIYRQHNPGFPKTWSSDALMYQGIDAAALTPTDLSDPRGEPARVLVGDGVSVSVSRRSEAMPFACKNADCSEIRFYHRGEFLVETELGPLQAGPGDVVVIPKGIVYRETPVAADGNVVFVMESREPIRLAEELWDSVAFAGLYIDYSTMDLPEPSEQDAAVETEVRVRFQGEVGSLVYGFDPCRDVVGWLGDPIVFRINVWDVPGIATSRGFLPPAAGALLYGEGFSFLFNVAPPPPLASEPAPDGSVGGSVHQNDYDEVWINHESAPAPHTDGHVWLLPRTIPHPGMKVPPRNPPNPVQRLRMMKVNFDTRAPLSLTDSARAALLPDPREAYYTSFVGMPADRIPPAVRRELDRARES